MRRLWCDRLPCGHIVGERADGTLLLCVLKNRHGKDCFHPLNKFAGEIAEAQSSHSDMGTVPRLKAVTSPAIRLLPPPASLVPLLEGCVNE
jgi:hypothetical protein